MGCRYRNGKAKAIGLAVLAFAIGGLLTILLPPTWVVAIEGVLLIAIGWLLFSSG